ncbi:MAG: hypothetical protein ACYS30_25735 [Planctomycetota bacterium]
MGWKPSAGLAKVAGMTMNMLGDTFKFVDNTVRRWTGHTVVTGDEWMRKSFAPENAGLQLYDALQKVPIFGTWVQAGLGIVAQTFSDKWDARAQELKDQEIWRIAYTAADESMVREEWMRRIRAGDDDPRFLWSELQDPVKAMWGEIAMDPATVFSTVIKPGKAVIGVIRNRAKIAKIAPALKDALPALKRALSGSVADAAEELGPALAQIRKHFDDVGEGIVTKGGKRGFHIETAGGKRFVSASDAADFLLIASKHFGDDADAMFDFMDGMIKIAKNGADDAEILEALGLLGSKTKKGAGIGINMSLSPQGSHAAYFLREMMTDPATGKVMLARDLLAKVEDPAQFLETVSEKIKKTVTKMNPSLTEQIKQNDTLAKLIDKYGEGHPVVGTYIKRYPQAAEKVSPVMRAVNAGHELAQKMVYRGHRQYIALETER